MYNFDERFQMFKSTSNVDYFNLTYTKGLFFKPQYDLAIDYMFSLVQSTILVFIQK